MDTLSFLNMKNGHTHTDEITSLYSDDPILCQVTDTDGDHEDFESDQLTYGTALYLREHDDK